MTLLTTARPYHQLSDALKEDVDAALTGFRAYLAMMRPKLSRVRPAPKNDTVSPLPASPVTESEPEVDFLSETDTQKRTRRGKTGESETAPLYDRTLKDRIAALIAERGPVTSADIGQYLDMNRQRAAVTIIDMQKQKRLFVVGYKKNEYNQTVKVLHTDPHFPYVSPDLPAADPVVKQERLTRIPSLAAVDRGRVLIERNFSRDSLAMQVFDQLCLRPRSIPELEQLFRRGSSCFKFMLDRMQGLGIVEKVGQDRNEGSGKLRTLFGVVEAEDTPPAPRVPPSPETIAAGRAKIMRGCLKGGGNTILVFDELCAYGPLTRGDLQERLGCHRTMIDVALRTLDAFGLVVDLGKTMGNETGHMRRLWDIKQQEVQP